MNCMLTPICTLSITVRRSTTSSRKNYGCSWKILGSKTCNFSTGKPIWKQFQKSREQRFFQVVWPIPGVIQGCIDLYFLLYIKSIWWEVLQGGDGIKIGGKRITTCLEIVTIPFLVFSVDLVSIMSKLDRINIR